MEKRTINRNGPLLGKKLLLIGGDVLTCDIVNKAHEMGLFVVVTDWYDPQRSPAKLLADEYWMTSIEDYDELAKQIKEKQIDGVLTGFTDSYLLPYQHLCEITGLPCYGTKEQFQIFTNKDKYKQLCRAYGVPTIEEFSVDADNIQFPVLVKPVDGSGSRGVMICNNKEELEKTIVQSKASSRRGKVVVERYMDCPEATVFWLFDNGKCYLTMIGNRHVKHNQNGNVIPLPVGYTFPSYLTPKYQEEVVENAKRMFQSVGVKNGVMFMQCKVEDGVCFVYDIGYRLTGSREYKIQEHVCGYDTLAMMINFAVTGKMCSEDVAARINPCGMQPSFNVSSLCAPGTIKEINGLDRVLQFPEVIDSVCAHFPGQTITEEMKGLLAQIAVRTIGTVPDKSLLYPMMKKIEDAIQIVSDKGENLLLPGIEEKDVLNVLL